MNRLIHALALGLTGSGLLLAAAASAAAAPGGPCSFAPDDVVSRALGSPSQAIQAIDTPDLQTCAVIDPNGGEPLSMFRISVTPGNALDQGVIQPGLGGSEPATPVQVEPVGGLGDSAAYLHLAVDGDTMLTLRVQVGNVVYAFNAKESASAPATLMSLGRAVLGQ